ncbi:MAG: 3-keto-disaccharide hydrolase [Bryobacteraceae bacterium]
MLIRALLLSVLVAVGGAGADWIDLTPPDTPLGKEIPGWTRIPIPPVGPVNSTPQWKVDAAAKTILCTGQGGHEWLRYDREFGDFVLQVEWRFTPKPGETKYNSGIGVRLSRYGELWTQAQTGLAGGYLFGVTLSNGEMTRVNLREQMKENRVKPAGEWNLYEIRAEGDTVMLSVNGAVVSTWTGVALRKGYIGLEAEGFEIAFRNLRVRPLGD